MTPKQTARIIQWVRSRTPEGHREVGIHHVDTNCPARTRAPDTNTSTEEYLSPCICGSLLLRLGTYVYSFDVKQEVFARIGEQQGGVVWMPPSTVPPIPQAIRRWGAG